MGWLTGQRALVTGVSAGIGAGHARALAADGAGLGCDAMGQSKNIDGSLSGVMEHFDKTGGM